MQQINDHEWISDDGEYTVFTDGKVRVYHLEDIVDLSHEEVPEEVDLFLESLEGDNE